MGYFVAFIHLRCPSQNLRIENGGHNNTELDQRICTYAIYTLSRTNFSFLLECAEFTDLFNKFIPPDITDSLF